MAALAYGVVKRIRTVPFNYGAGKDINLVTILINSAIATDDTIDSAALSVDGILAVLAVNGINGAGAIVAGATYEVTLTQAKQVENADNAAGTGLVLSGTGNDTITFLSDLDGYDGVLLTLLTN